MSPSSVSAGIAFAKALLDVALRFDNEVFSIANDGAALKVLVKCLRRIKLEFVVLEANGGLEIAAVATLSAVPISLVVVIAHQMPDIARPTGTLT